MKIQINNYLYLQMLIMDEADEMLQHGFMKQITGIYKYLPAEVGESCSYNNGNYSWLILVLC